MFGIPVVDFFYHNLMNHKTLQDEKPLTAEVPELPISVRKKAEAMVNKSEKEECQHDFEGCYSVFVCHVSLCARKMYPVGFS